MPTYSIPPATRVYTKTVEKSIPSRPEFRVRCPGRDRWSADPPRADRLGPGLLVGWGILRILALVPILGGLVWFAAVVFGLGALLVAIWRARTTSRAAPAAA